MAGIIGSGTDVCPMYSGNCLKGSRESLVLAVNMLVGPDSGWGRLRLGCIFLICSAFWIAVKGYGGGGVGEEDGKKRADANGLWCLS